MTARASELGGSWLCCEHARQHIRSAHVFPSFRGATKLGIWTRPNTMDNQRRSLQRDEGAREWRQEGVRLAPQPNSLNHRTNAQQACHLSISHMLKNTWKLSWAALYTLSLMYMNPHESRAEGPLCWQSLADLSFTSRQCSESIKGSLLINMRRPDRHDVLESKNRDGVDEQMRQEGHAEVGGKAVESWGGGAQMTRGRGGGESNPLFD